LKGGYCLIFNQNSTKPIYIQIAEWIETEMIKGNLKSEDKVYSQYQLAEMFNINPATAAKGLKLLADEGVLYKKRGLGMFVSIEGLNIILLKRKKHTLAKLIEELVSEAERLKISDAELIQMIKLAKQKDRD
jgi:GntR family transcriptional regulator